MSQTPLKNQAEEIIEAVDHDIQTVESKPVAVQKEVDRKADALADRLFNIVSDVDLEAAAARAQALKAKYPDATPQELANKLIKEKCQKTGTIGAVTSGTSLIPGIGTAAAITLGAATDIGATFKLQSEMVLEIAALYDYPLTEEEKQRVVMVITGISAGTTTLVYKMGQSMAVKAGEKFAGKALLKAIPIVSIFASAGTNVLSTYIIGQRADTYFRLGPEAVPTWADSLRAVSGVDERKIGGWLAESGKSTGTAIVAGAGKVGGVSKTAGTALVSGTRKAAKPVGAGLSTGAKAVGSTAKKGGKAYIRTARSVWSAVFRWPPR